MAQQQIPEEACRLGEVYSLGMPTAIYRIHYTRADLLFFWSQIAMALLAVVVALSFILAFEVFHAHVANLFFPVLIVFFTLNITNISRATRRKTPVAYDPFARNARVYLYKDGFIYVYSIKPEVVRWDEIKQVRCYTYQDTKHARGLQPPIIVIRNDGKKLTLSANIADVVSLSNIIQQEYLQRKST
ncbi:MAG: hypothetical protein NVS4B12_24610 [Ktedonobacteraceae bacterium]